MSLQNPSVYLVSFMHMLKHCSCFHFSPPPLPLSANFFKPTMKFLCATVWEKPQKCLGAEAGDVMDSWVRSAGKPWVSEMEPLQVSMAERTNRRKHWGNPVILQHWPIINTQSRGRKPLLKLKSILRACEGVYTTQSSATAQLFYTLITEDLLFYFHPDFFLLWTLRKGYFFDC